MKRLDLLEVKTEGVFGQALELRETDFGRAPEAFGPVDTDRAPGELVLGAVDAEAAVTEIDEAVVSAPSVRSESTTMPGSTRPRIIPCGAAFEQSATISV